MKIKNLYNGKIKIKRTKDLETPYPGNRDYFILNKISNIENFFFKMWNKYKFDDLSNYPKERKISWKGQEEMKKYKDKAETGNMSRAEYFYFNLQKEKRIIKDLKNCKFDKYYKLTDCQFNKKINQLEESLK